jgi:hypothetical protein
MIWSPNDSYIKYWCESEFSNKRIKFCSVAVPLWAGFAVHILGG